MGKLGEFQFKAVAIVGSTASGKTEIAVKLARKIRENGREVELISADSRKVYKYFDIGTAKPTDYLDEFRWHFINIIEPYERFSAKKFEELAREIILRIRSEGKIPIVVGGTWLYIRALELGFFDEGEDSTLRYELEKKLAQEGKEKLFEFLKSIDPLSAKKINPNDTYRVIRAIEVKLKTGKSISEIGFKERFPLLKFGIYRSKEVILERIKKRVVKQINMGLIEETRRLKEKFGETTPLLKSIAYYEPYLYITGKITFDDMVKLMIKRNFRYSRYQVKVFSREGVIWFQKEQDMINFIFDICMRFF